MARKQKAQPRQRGTITERGEGKWLVRVYTGKNPQSGKREYTGKVVEGTYKQAEQALTKVLRDIDTHSFVRPTKDTVAEFGQRWLDGRSSITACTKLNYQEVLDRITARAFGALKLTQVNHDAIQGLYQSLVDAGYGKAVLLHTRTVLNQIMLHAIRTHQLIHNPVSYVEVPNPEVQRADSGDRTVLTTNHVHLLLERTKDDPFQHALWMVTQTTALRPEEVCGLQWPDIDFDSGLLTLNRAIAKVASGKYEPAPMKTQKSQGVVGLPAGTLSALQVWRRAQAARMLSLGERFDRRQPWVFTAPMGGYLTTNHISKLWRRTTKGIEGFPAVPLYKGTRHTVATLLLESGVPLEDVSKLLRHSTLRLTSDTYSHITPERAKAMAGAVNAAILQA